MVHNLVDTFFNGTNSTIRIAYCVLRKKRNTQHEIRNTKHVENPDLSRARCMNAGAFLPNFRKTTVNTTR